MNIEIIFKYMEAYPVTIGMNVKKFANVSKEWVEFIMLNRNKHISHPVHTYREPTHQICFCTLASLYALELVDEREFRSAIDNITETILETMVVDFKMTESAAIKTLYSSKSYESLSNANTLFWQKHWQEIYEMLKGELKT